MQRCSSTSSGGHVMGSCSCGLFHTQTNSSFSMLFSMPNHHHHHHRGGYDQYEPSDHHMYSFASPSSSVDCTLSLGTPSTRLTADDDVEKRGGGGRRSVSNFCWDLLQPKHSTSAASKGNNNSNRGGSGNDALLARRCANCDTTSTPLWRNGPRGPKSLCNACGIRFKKEERRATAAAASSANGATSSWMSNSSSSSSSSSQAQKMQCFAPSSNEFRFMDHHDHDLMTSHHHEPAIDGGIPFLSWRLNVTDRPSLVHDFTR